MSTRRKARRPQRPTGRPRLLSEDVEARLVAASRTGVAVELAAEMAGVSRTTFLRWMRRGRAEAEAREADEDPDPAEEEYLILHSDRRTDADRPSDAAQPPAAKPAPSRPPTRCYRPSLPSAG